MWILGATKWVPSSCHLLFTLGPLITVAFGFGPTVSSDAATIIVWPGQTITSGINKASPGDTVFVKAGAYNGFTVNKSIIVRGERLFSGEYGVTINGGINISASNCTVDGFYLNRGGIIGTGSQTANTPSNVKIVNNHAYRSTYLYKIVGSNWLVEGNTFQRVVAFLSDDADYGRMFGSGHVFRGNYLFGTAFGSGMDVPPNGPHTDAMQFFANNGEKLHNILIEQNFITDFFQGFFIADERSVTDISNLTIRDNIFWGQPLPNVGNMHGRPSWGICVGKNRGATHVRIEHNLVYNVGNATGMRGGHVNGYVGKNLFIDCSTAYASYSGDIHLAGDFMGNPMFRDVTEPLGSDGKAFTWDDGWLPLNALARGFGPRVESDTDQDLLDDEIELTVTFTDPNDMDSDDDGVIDGTEVQMGYDPLDGGSFPTLNMKRFVIVALSLILAAMAALHLRQRLLMPGAPA